MQTHQLRIFHAGIAAVVRDPKQPDLSARQMDILLRIHAAPKATLTVRGMAEAMNVSKPAITRGLDRLTELGFISRVPDLKDRRSCFAAIEQRGKTFVERLDREMRMHADLLAA